jgi:hypothetical protein
LTTFDQPSSPPRSQSAPERRAAPIVQMSDQEKATRDRRLHGERKQDYAKGGDGKARAPC